jgi:hypothetical protein
MIKKIAGEEISVTDIALINWTIQEAEHLKMERREAGDPDGKTSLNKLLAVLEHEPAEQAGSEDPVTQIASAPNIQLVGECPADPPSFEVVTSPEQDIVLA